MPIKINFKRTHRYNVSAKDLYVIRIFTLDGTCVEYTVSTTTTGRDALEYVAQRLDIEDTCFFGFKYEDWSGESRWLFLNKSVKKQLDKHARQHALTLTVMLFIDNPQFISDSQLRRFFYLQLRQDVATGLLPVTLKLGIKLSAYSLQADFGDFVDVETTLSNWRERSSLNEGSFCGAFDLSTTEYVDDILWGYLHLQGVSQDNAIWYFLDEIRHIPRYGVRTFRGMTCRSEPAELGVSRNGINITTLEPQQRTTANLKWEHIKDLTYSRKTFTIQLLKKNKAVHFLFEDNENARYLWQFCIQMHGSYIEYWTRVKSAPQQPAIHVSEPPDILRGTELRCLNAESPMLNEALPEGSNSPLVPSLVTSSPSNLVNELNHVPSNVHPVHGMEFPTDYTPLSQNQVSEHRTFKIDPTRFATGPTGNGIGTVAQGTANTTTTEPFLSSSAPAESGPLERDNLALLTAIREDMAGGGGGGASAGDSEAGTLVGQWSVRSAADTLDSQMINQGCVTCLPGRECLRPAAGWFQPRAGIAAAHTTSWNQSGHRAEKNAARKQSKPESAEQSREQREVKSAHHAHHHHRRHHHQSEAAPGPQLGKRPDQRAHRTRQPKRQRQQDGKTIPVSGLVPRTGIPMGGVNVIIDGAPSSPSSLASSDTSSGHRMASSRASFSSTSSSCCSERVKKPRGSSGRHAGRRDEDGRSCSSSSSSTSSINSAAAEVADAAVASPREFDEGNKKSHFGFTAALCSVAHNIAFKPGAKFGPKQSCGTTIGSSTGSATLNTGKKLWNDLIQSNHGGLRPLLSGFMQHHYRPQLQLKRQQAAADATLQEQGLSLGRTGSTEGASGMDQGAAISRTRKPRRNSGGHTGLGAAVAVAGAGGSNSTNPLHDFHRWLTAAKQRLPAAWTSSVASRGMTLQISAPLPSSSTTAEHPTESEPNGSDMDSKIKTLGGLVYCLPSESDELSVLQTGQPGRLARSSSEACARDLTGRRGLRFTKNPSAHFNTSQQEEPQQSPFCTDSMGHPSAEQLLHGAIPPGRTMPPTIHLYPPSPTQTTYGHNSPSGDSDPIHTKQLWSYGNHSEDSGCPTTQTDGREVEQSGGQACHQSDATHSTTGLDLFVRRTSLETGTSNDPRSQANMPLQRQGAFRVSPSWRPVPRPLNLTEMNRLTSPARNVSEGTTTLSSLLFPGNPDLVSEQQQQQQQPKHLKPLSRQSPVCNQVVLPHSDLGVQQPQVQYVSKVNVNRVLEGLDSTTNGHFSAPPGTPSGRLHFVWTEMAPDSVPATRTAPIADQTLSHEWHDSNNSGARSSNAMNLSNYLAAERRANPESGLDQPDDPRLMSMGPGTGNEGRELSKEAPQQPAHNTAASPGHPLNSLLTTSSSSEQSSAQRPPSSGPIHLLTHSDIHQLLSLTNIRETELAHRLLAEYRQALLQQQSLHTNSVSTPNLTASQELQMFSSSTAAEDIEEVEVDPIEPERSKSKRTKHPKTHTQRGQDADRRTKGSQSRQGTRNQTTRSEAVNHDHEASDQGQEHATATRRRRRRRRKEPSSTDSPDYVNAAAFCGERCGAGERPLSLASSTDMESNGTFRVLSSLDTRTSSVVCGSFGNLTAPGTSFGSAEDNGIDLIHGIANAAVTSVSTAVAADVSPVQSVNLSWDQLAQRHVATNRSAREPGGLHQLSKGTEPGKSCWNKTAEQSPPDLCLSSTYPNLCEGQHGQREAGTYSIPRQPGTLGDLSARQRDSPTRRNIVVGEYENLECLSNEKLHLLRSLRQPVLPNRQPSSHCSSSGSSATAAAVAAVTAPSTDAVVSVNAAVYPGDAPVVSVVSEPNHNGSISTLAYSTTTTATTTSVPASPSSDSVSSSSSISSTATSSSSELGCTAVISDPRGDSREDDADTFQQCQPNTHQHSPVACHGSRPCLANASQEHLVCNQHKHDCHACHYHPDQHMNLAMLLRTRECTDHKCAMRRILFVPQNSRTKRRGDSHCQCRFHCPETFLTKSNSLRLNNTGNFPAHNTTATSNTAKFSTNANMVEVCEYSLGRKKARSFDPFAHATCSAASRSRQLTPVRFQPGSTHLSSSQSTQNCRKPIRRPHKLLSGVPNASRTNTSPTTTTGDTSSSKLHTRRLKPCLKTLPWSTSRAACLSYSDEDATEALCYMSDDDRHRITDDATTSATLSATESGCLSSASSYSFSASSLDAPAEDVCSHYHHWYAPSCAPDAPSCCKEQERLRRGGSLDPSTSTTRAAISQRVKRISQPCSHRNSSHRKRSSEQDSLISNMCSLCACTQLPPPPLCPIAYAAHMRFHPDRESDKRELHHSLEEESTRSKPNRRAKTRQSPPRDSAIRPHAHQHHNDSTALAGGIGTVQCENPHHLHRHSGHQQHVNNSRHHHHHHHHYDQNHQHRHHHTNESASRSAQTTVAKPPVAKRKSNELHELAAADEAIQLRENLSEAATTRSTSAEISLKLVRPTELTLAPRTHDCTSRTTSNRKSPPGLSHSSPQKETTPYGWNSPTGSSQHTDRTPTSTGSRDLATDSKRQPLIGLPVSSIPRTSPDLLARTGSRCSTSNDAEPKKSHEQSGCQTPGKYAPSMIPSRARQSDGRGNQSQLHGSKLPSPLSDSAHTKTPQSSGSPASAVGSHSQPNAPSRPKILQSSPSRNSQSFPSPVLCTSSLLLSPIQAPTQTATLNQWSTTRSPGLRQATTNTSAMQMNTLGSPSTQPTATFNQLGAKSQLVRSGSLEPTTDLVRQGAGKMLRQFNTATLTPPPRNLTPEEQRTALTPNSGLLGKLPDKKVPSTGSVIDSLSCANSSSNWVQSLKRFDNGITGESGSAPCPVLSSTRYTSSPAKRT